MSGDVRGPDRTRVCVADPHLQAQAVIAFARPAHAYRCLIGELAVVTEQEFGRWWRGQPITEELKGVIETHVTMWVKRHLLVPNAPWELIGTADSEKYTRELTRIRYIFGTAQHFARTMRLGHKFPTSALYEFWSGAADATFAEVLIARFQRWCRQTLKRPDATHVFMTDSAATTYQEHYQ